MPRLQQPRVYLPTNARASHYLLAEIIPDEGFYTQFSDINTCYDEIARQLFTHCDENEIHNVHLIANDKLPVVRFSEEAYQFETQKQMLFFYNPQYHEAHKVHYSKDQASKKIRLLFLATGSDLRAHSAQFHNKVKNVLSKLQAGLFANQPQFKVRDHQHLAYDIFAREKGNKESYGYKLRSLYPRYQARDCIIPEDHAEMTYVTFSIPVTRAIKAQMQAQLSQQDVSPFYKYFADAFKRSCDANNLTHLGMVANGAAPIVRNSKIDKNEGNAELQKLSFDVESNQPQLKCFYQSDNLEETLHFVIVASAQDKQPAGYGKFMNQVEKSIDQFCNELPINKERQQLTVRFYQHISYPF